MVFHRMNKARELTLLINSETPLIYIETWEEERVEAMLEALAVDLQIPLFFWTVTTGLQRAGLPNAIFRTCEPMAALNHIGNVSVDALYLLKDFHPYLEQDVVLRKLRDLCDQFRRTRRSVLISAPVLQVPVELQKDVAIFRLDVPDSAQLKRLTELTFRRLKASCTLRKDLDKAGLDRLAAGLRGLTLNEAERVLTKAMLEHGGLDERCLDAVLAKKKEIISHQGVLEFVEPSDDFQSMGELAPAVLWIDEIEKGFAASSGAAATDGEVSNRILGSFLSWLQERKAPVFVVATSNDITVLPPELVRKGRFDEIFFVDLPGPKERQQIFRVHLKRKGRNPAAFDLEALAGASEGFSGAEIEQAVKGALFSAYADRQELSTEIVLGELGNTMPLSVTRREEVDALRHWARGRAVRANTTVPASAS